MAIQDQATHAAKRAYTQAIAVGAARHIAFDVACAAYRASHPELGGDALKQIVASRLSLSKHEMRDIEH